MPEKKVLTELEMRAEFSCKKLTIMAELEGIVKTGENKAQHYSYVEAAEVFIYVRALLIKHKLAFGPTSGEAKILDNIPTKSGSMALLGIPLSYRITDADTGYYEDYNWYGSAADSGDKALYKAYTSGLKYFLIDMFLLPTANDVEAFTLPTDEQPQATPQPPAKKAPQAASKPQTTQPATKPAPANISPSKQYVKDLYAAAAAEKLSTSKQPEQIVKITNYVMGCMGVPEGDYGAALDRLKNIGQHELAFYWQLGKVAKNKKVTLPSNESIGHFIMYLFGAAEFETFTDGVTRLPDLELAEFVEAWLIDGDQHQGPADEPQV